MQLVLPITLALAAACALINVWLSLRVGAIRRAEKISVGDGGSEALQRRMRAQLNFVENTPIILVLVAAIELARPDQFLLPWVAIAYIVGRVLHGFGMDGKRLAVGRMIGTITTLAIQIFLAGIAVGVLLRQMNVF